MERGWPLLHLLSEVGRRSILGAGGPKDSSGCAVDYFQTFDQQAGVTVVKLAVGKSCLGFQSQGFTNHKSGSLGFLLVNHASYKSPALSSVQNLTGYLTQQYRESLGGLHVG